MNSKPTKVFTLEDLLEDLLEAYNMLLEDFKTTYCDIDETGVCHDKPRLQSFEKFHSVRTARALIANAYEREWPPVLENDE